MSTSKLYRSRKCLSSFSLMGHLRRSGRDEIRWLPYLQSQNRLSVMSAAWKIGIKWTPLSPHRNKTYQHLILDLAHFALVQILSVIKCCSNDANNGVQQSSTLPKFVDITKFGKHNRLFINTFLCVHCVQNWYRTLSHNCFAVKRGIANINWSPAFLIWTNMAAHDRRLLKQISYWQSASV